MLKLSQLWADARLRAVSPQARPSQTNRTATAPLAALALGALCTFASGGAASATPTVATKEGVVKGFVCPGTTSQRCTVPGIAAFLGIPYAEPPIGNLRWRPPKKHAAWAGVKKTRAFGPTCAQVVTLGVFAGPANNNEDCLYLNVFTPNLNPSAKLPVIFWIHGGGNVDGESNDYDGSKLASQGHAVVVTINYRLNLMGFLAHPALNNEGHLWGNYGVLDQDLALKWVRRNIAMFGGDKNNVTVGGQSAGAQDTGIAVISPLASGLLDRAIFESSAPVNLTLLSVALARGEAFAVAAGCGSGTDAATAKCLRSLPASKVEQLAGTASANSAFISGPMIDGSIIPQQPIQAWHNGQFSHMPMMNGRTFDEANFSLGITEYFSTPQAPPTAAQYLAFVNTTYTAPNAVPPGLPYPAGTAAAVLAHYPLSAYATPQLAWNALVSDSADACTTRHVNRILYSQVPLYGYSFDDRTAPSYFPKLPGFQFLAFHTADIQYLFPLYHGGPAPPSVIHYLNDKQQDLSDQLVSAWTNFAWTGNPNGIGNSPWPRYNNHANKPTILSQNIPQLSTYTDAQFSKLHQCDFWDTILPYTYGPNY